MRLEQVICRSRRIVAARLAILLGVMAVAGLLGCSKDLSESAKQGSAHATELASRAKRLFNESRFDEGIDILLRAIAANPDDAGQNLDLAATDSLEEIELQHAEQQLKRMLADRPEMALCLKPGDDLWNWTVRKFAGEDAGRPVDWDAKDPVPLNSDSRADGGHIWIEVRNVQGDSPEQSCDALWARLVLELYRVANFKRVHELTVLVQSDKISQGDYISEQMILDERAIEKTRAFYIKFYAPMRLSKGAQHLWLVDWHCTRFFADRKSREAAWKRDPRWTYHSNYFKILWTTSAAARQHRSQASAYLQDVSKQEDHLCVGQRTALHCYLAIFQFEENNLELASAELETAEQLWPKSRAVQQLSAYMFPNRTASLNARSEPPTPKNAVTLALQARSKFDRGHVAGAVKDVLEAIEINPGDAGTTYTTEANTKISQDSLQHGESQVQAMLRDRPGMAEFISPGDQLWTWAVRQFAGEKTNQLVDWDPVDPSPNEAGCRIATDGQHAAIKIRDLESLGTSAERFERYWAHVVFEFHNLSHGGGRSLDIFQDAREGKYSRDAFIVAVLDREHIAAQCTRVFFLNHFLPYMQAKGLTTNPRIWHCFSFFPDEVTRLKYYRALHHWEYYGQHYDQLARHSRDVELQRAHQLQKDGRLDEALVIVNQLVEKHGEWSNGHYVRGVILFRRGQFEDSLSDFKKGLELEPTHIGMHYFRGQTYAQLQRWEEALNDFSALVILAPDQPHGYFGRARVLLESPSKNGDEYPSAIEDARRACELTKWKSAEHLQLLIKAYSAVGDADNARSIEEKLKSSPRDHSGDPPTTSRLKYPARSVVSSAPTYAYAARGDSAGPLQSPYSLT